jgi:CRP-like cAMP-binding protein
LKAGDFFGEMSLVTGEPRSATCTARIDVLCYVIDHGAFKTLLAESPKVAEQLSAVLTSRQATLEKKGGELSARAAQAIDHRSKLLARIRSFFDLR